MKKLLEYLKKDAKNSMIKSLKEISLSHYLFPQNVMRDAEIIKSIEEQIKIKKDAGEKIIQLDEIMRSLFEELQDASPGEYKFSQRQLFLFILQYCKISI